GAYRTIPPSTQWVEPLTYDAAFELRDTNTSATSDGSPMRPSGTIRSRASTFSGSSSVALLIGVTLAPGATLLTRISYGAAQLTGCASSCTVRPFDAQQGVKPGRASLRVCRSPHP